MSDDDPQRPSTKAHDHYSPHMGAAFKPDLPQVSASERFRLIERTAYYLAERRGFEAGHELEDWLAAEREVDAIVGYSLTGGGS